MDYISYKFFIDGIHIIKKSANSITILDYHTGRYIEVYRDVYDNYIEFRIANKEGSSRGDFYKFVNIPIWLVIGTEKPDKDSSMDPLYWECKSDRPFIEIRAGYTDCHDHNEFSQYADLIHNLAEDFEWNQNFDSTVESDEYDEDEDDEIDPISDLNDFMQTPIYSPDDIINMVSQLHIKKGY